MTPLPPVPRLSPLLLLWLCGEKRRPQDYRQCLLTYLTLEKCLSSCGCIILLFSLFYETRINTSDGRKRLFRQGVWCVVRPGLWSETQLVHHSKEFWCVPRFAPQDETILGKAVATNPTALHRLLILGIGGLMQNLDLNYAFKEVIGSWPSELGHPTSFSPSPFCSAGSTRKIT